MNLKFLLEPTIEKIREQAREEARAEAWEEGQIARDQVWQSWLDEQIRTGATFNADLKPPTIGDNGNGKHKPGENGKSKK